MPTKKMRPAVGREKPLGCWTRKRVWSVYLFREGGIGDGESWVGPEVRGWGEWDKSGRED